MVPTSKSSTFLQIPTFSLIFLLFFLLPVSSSVATIYDHLRHNGLPIGLFPKGITDFDLDPTTGRFQINLTSPCNANKIENQLHYDFNVSGFLSVGNISGLSGVKQQDLFLWFPVKCIRVDVPSSGLIYFDVGVVDKQLSLSLFENPLECTASDPGPVPNGPKNEPQNIALETGQGDSLQAAA